MPLALVGRMTNINSSINSFPDLTVWQVFSWLARELEALFELIHRRKLGLEALLVKGVRLAEPVGKMLHGVVESLETRDTRD
jgi:hypothetical protein